MKDVKQCSISSVAFILEVDAYETLHNYIESIRVRYADNVDGEEIISDIEARIAELILSTHSNDRVVAKPLIDNIIRQMGSADDICDDGSLSEEKDDNEQPKTQTRRQLYRNVDDAAVGGVCSGIAAYVGCSTSIVRLIALLLTFCMGMSLWVYIILWVVMPAAVTARQKLEMRGEPITVSSIKDFYTSPPVEEVKSTASNLLMIVGRVIRVILKIAIFMILALFVFTFMAIVIGSFMLICVVGIVGANLYWVHVVLFIMLLLSLLLLFGLGIYTFIQLINSRSIKWGVVLSILALWAILSMSSALFLSANRASVRESVKELQEKMGKTHFSIRILDRDSDEKFFLGSKKSIVDESEE